MDKMIDTKSLMKIRPDFYKGGAEYYDTHQNLLEIGKVYCFEIDEPICYIEGKFLGWQKDEDDDYYAIFEPLKNIEIAVHDMFFRIEEVKKGGKNE